MIFFRLKHYITLCRVCQGLFDFILFFNSYSSVFSQFIECHAACVLGDVIFREEYIQGVFSAFSRCEEPVLLVGVFSKNAVIGTGKVEAAELDIVS